jgi:hypothetical protein
MSATSASRPAGGFASRIAEAQRQLAESAARAGLKHDPYQHLITAQSDIIGLFPELVAHIEATRQPVRDDDLRRAVVQGVNSHAGNVVRALGWRNVMIGAGLLVATLMIGAGAGYWLGRNEYVRVPEALGVALTGPAAADWANLIRLNDITRANKVCSVQMGGMACSVSLWVKPPTPLPSAP